MIPPLTTTKLFKRNVRRSWDNLESDLDLVKIGVPPQLYLTVCFDKLPKSPCASVHLPRKGRGNNSTYLSVHIHFLSFISPLLFHLPPPPNSQLGWLGCTLCHLIQGMPPPKGTTSQRGKVPARKHVISCKPFWVGVCKNRAQLKFHSSFKHSYTWIHAMNIRWPFLWD